jgi:hypothetical protein
VIIFGLIQFLLKKSNQIEIFYLKKTETSSVWFDFLGQNRFFQFDLVLAWFFPVLAQFFLV